MHILDNMYQCYGETIGYSCILEVLDDDRNRVTARIIECNKIKTYAWRDSQYLCMAERTACPSLTDLRSYVKVLEYKTKLSLNH